MEHTHTMLWNNPSCCWKTADTCGQMVVSVCKVVIASYFPVGCLSYESGWLAWYISHWSSFRVPAWWKQRHLWDTRGLLSRPAWFLVSWSYESVAIVRENQWRFSTLAAKRQMKCYWSSFCPKHLIPCGSLWHHCAECSCQLKKRKSRFSGGKSYNILHRHY